MSRWHQRAACRDMDTELFFPAPGDQVAAGRALAVCRACPVRTECLQAVLETGDRYGIWGGTLPEQRTARPGDLVRAS